MSNFEIRANIKLLTKLKWKHAQIVEALQQVYGESSPPRAVVNAWIKRFKEVKEEDPVEGGSSTATDDQNVVPVRNLVEVDRRKTVDAIAFSIMTEDRGLSKFFRSVNARFAVPARFAAFPFPHAHTGRHLGQRYTAITHGQTSDTQYRDIFSKCRLSVFKRGGLVGIDKLVASHSVERDTRLNRYD